MENVEMSIDENDILTLRINLRHEIAPSRSGKSILIGTTHGNYPLWGEHGPHPEGISVNVNVSRRRSTDERLNRVWRMRREGDPLPPGPARSGQGGHDGDCE